VSTYTPLSRGFDDGRARELAETRNMYARVKARDDASGDVKLAIGKRVYDAPWIPDYLKDQFAFLIHDLLKHEVYLSKIAAPDFTAMDMKAFVEYRNFLHLKEHYYQNETAYCEGIEEALVNFIHYTCELIPKLHAPSPFTIPLIFALPDPKDAITGITQIASRYCDRGILLGLSNRLYINLCEASGRDPYDEHSRKPLKTAASSSLPPDKLINQYLSDTPFHALLSTPVPLRLTHEDRFGHTHIIGGTGAGKTVLIEKLILNDINADDPPSIIIIDPHSDLVRKLFRADLGIEDRVILIDPRDIQHPPAINPFAINRERLDSYDETTREQVTAGVIQTFSYLFGSLFNLDLTGKQSVFFRYCIRLLLSLPDTMGRNATILDMLHLMADDTPYRGAIAALPDIQRDFFERDFKSATFKPTKEQIRYRLQAIIENPTMARLFTSPETKVDLFSEMNRGAIILVDTAKDFLKDNSAVFGQLIISLVLQAVIERAAIAEAERKPTFLYVDEAASYFSSNIDDLLTEARKFKTGLVLAHQYGDQASSSLRASLAANTNIKMASGLSASDARMMAPDMRTTPDFILGQPRLQFATHIRNVTPSAVSIPIRPTGALPCLSDEALAALIERNRAATSTSRDLQPEQTSNPIGFGVPVTEKPATPEPKSRMGFQLPNQDEDDISSDW
jgi:Helicase HerA, central domain